jgi:hypothetical protein
MGEEGPFPLVFIAGRTDCEEDLEWCALLCDKPLLVSCSPPSSDIVALFSPSSDCLSLTDISSPVLVSWPSDEE